MIDPGDKLYYGSGEYTRTDDQPTVSNGCYLGRDDAGHNTIDTPAGHYVQTGTVEAPHSPNWERMPG
jgi:hypothetical protein